MMWGMAGRSRRIGDPVVAGRPVGVRIRARIHVTQAEVAALRTIGSFLGSVYRAELASRVRCGRLDREAQALWRAERKQAITAVSSSRWAGAITRAVEDQYQLGMRGLGAHAADLRAAVEALEQTSDPVTRHHAAAAAIGRRGLGVAIRRRPAGPRTRQRTDAGTPPARPGNQPTAAPRGCRSSGPPTPPRGVRVRRTTLTASGQHRSGRTGLTPAQQSGTVEVRYV
jgi:hypothetical protein